MKNIGTEFIWWFGIVEDRDDPLQLGRVRVRCYGYHTDDKNAIPTEDLPWAQPIQNITSAAMGNIGHSPTGLLEGSWVVGFFMDGSSKQKPIIIGSLSGIPTQEIIKEKGFNDPNGTYPNRLNEPDVNRLARGNETISGTKFDHAVLNKKDTAVTSDIPIANSTDVWNEPLSAYAATYPKNHVFESESGHIKEFDDTTNNERIHEYHKAGTFYEIDKDGNRVTRIVGNNYEIIAKNNNVNIKGDVNLTIDSNCNTYIKKDWNIQVDGNVNEVIKGTLTQTVTKAVTENYGATHTETAGGNITITGPKIDLNP
jgi:hypothetical protein